MPSAALPQRLIPATIVPKPRMSRRNRLCQAAGCCHCFRLPWSAWPADGPADNQLDKVRPVPPKGITVTEADRLAIQSGLDELGREIDGLRTSLKERPKRLALAGCPDLPQRRPLRPHLQRVLQRQGRPGGEEPCSSRVSTEPNS